MKTFRGLCREPKGRHERETLREHWARTIAHWDADGNYLGYSLDDPELENARFWQCVDHEHVDHYADFAECWCGVWWYPGEHDGVPEHEHAALPDPITWTDALPY